MSISGITPLKCTARVDKGLNVDQPPPREAKKRGPEGPRQQGEKTVLDYSSRDSSLAASGLADSASGDIPNSCSTIRDHAASASDEDELTR